MQYCVFKVFNRPYCCWEIDLKKRNLDFIDSIDPSYFLYNVEIHSANLKGEQRQYAAFSIRLIYHHVLETLFSLICASLQAPKCIYGWIQKYQLGDIRQMTNQINSNQITFTNVLDLVDVNWNSYMNKILFVDEKKEGNIIEISSEFAKFLINTCNDYLNDFSIKEYNSLKHGFRVKQKGFKAKIKSQETLINKDKMFNLSADSEFGSSFYWLEDIGGLKSKDNRHFQSRWYGLNWNPQNLASSIIIASLLIENIQAFLLIRNGVRNVTYRAPADLGFFKVPWEKEPGIYNLNFDFNINKDMIKLFTKEELDFIYEKNKMPQGNSER